MKRIEDTENINLGFQIAPMIDVVFVIMLLNLPQDEDGADRLRWLKFVGIPLGLFFLFLVVATLWNVEPAGSSQAQFVGSPQAIGESRRRCCRSPRRVGAGRPCRRLRGGSTNGRKPS